MRGPYRQTVALLGLGTLLGACVHGHLERTGRLRLGGGGEGLAPILEQQPTDAEATARIHVEALALATPQRLRKHLRRRAARLGCDGLTEVRFQGKTASGMCVKRRRQVPDETPKVARAPSQALLQRLAADGPTAAGLLALLQDNRSRSPREQTWRLQWYLEHYPNSRYRAEVEALLVPEDELTLTAAAVSSVSSAPRLE